MKSVTALILIFSLHVVFAQSADTCYYYLHDSDYSTFYGDTNDNVLSLTSNESFELRNQHDVVIAHGHCEWKADTLNLFNNKQSYELCVYYTDAKSDSIKVSWLSTYTDENFSMYTYAIDTIEVIINQEIYICPPGEFTLNYSGVIEVIEIPYLNIHDFRPHYPNGKNISFTLDTYNYQKRIIHPIQYQLEGDNLVLINNTESSNNLPQELKIK